VCGKELEPVQVNWGLWIQAQVCRECEGEWNRREARKERLRKLPDLLAEAGIPSRFEEAVIEQIEPRFQNLAGTLFIHGPAGTGKTHLAVALLREHLKECERYYLSARFVEVPELLMEMRDTFREKAGRSEMDLLEDYSGCDLLVLDDLGAEKPSEWVTQTLYLLVNRRYTREKRTIVTSNLSLKQLNERLGDRIVSRLAGMCRVVELTGKDRRLKRVK